MPTHDIEDLDEFRSLPPDAGDTPMDEALSDSASAPLRPPVSTLAYRNPGLKQPGRPMAITVIGVFSLLLSGLGLALGFFNLPDIRKLHQQAVAGNQETTSPPEAHPSLRPLTDDFHGRDGLSRPDRVRFVAHVAALARGDLSPDRAVLLGDLLAEVGAEFVGGTLPAELSSFTVEREQLKWPDSIERANEPGFVPSLRVSGMQGSIVLDNRLAVMKFSDGREIRLNGAILRGRDGVSRWAYQPIERFVAHRITHDGLSINAMQLAALVDTLRTQELSSGANVLVPLPVALSSIGPGTLQVSGFGTMSWIFPSGAIRAVRDPARTDPATGRAIGSVQGQAVNPLSDSRRTMWWILCVAYAELTLAALMFVLSCGLLMDVRGSRQAIIAWCIVRILLIPASVALVFVLQAEVRGVIESVGGRLKGPDPGGVGTRTLISAALGMAFPVVVLMVLNATAVRAYHRSSGMIPARRWARVHAVFDRPGGRAMIGLLCLCAGAVLLWHTSFVGMGIGGERLVGAVVVSASMLLLAWAAMRPWPSPLTSILILIAALGLVSSGTLRALGQPAGNGAAGRLPANPLAHSDPEARLQALAELTGTTRIDWLMPALTSAIFNDPDERVRRKSASVIASSSDWHSRVGPATYARVVSLTGGSLRTPTGLEQWPEGPAVGISTAMLAPLQNAGAIADSWLDRDPLESDYVWRWFLTILFLAVALTITLARRDHSTATTVP